MDIHAYEPQVFRLPFPADFDDEPFESLQARANALCGAAERIYELSTQTGQTIAIPEDAKQVARNVFAGVAPVTSVVTTAEQIHLTALLQAYDIPIVQNAQQIRNFCTNILIDKAATGSTDQVKLRAVEMLGKIKDVALFEERSTVLVAEMSTEQIQTGLRDKINRMRAAMSAQPVTDVHPTETK